MPPSWSVQATGLREWVDAPALRLLETSFSLENYTDEAGCYQLLAPT